MLHSTFFLILGFACLILTGPVVAAVPLIRNEAATLWARNAIPTEGRWARSPIPTEVPWARGIDPTTYPEDIPLNNRRAKASLPHIH